MAKKYIDADLLRKEIESRMGNCDANSKNPNQLLWAELAALLPFIDSLQQEQPCEDLEKEVEWEWVHREKQEVDLIECAEMDKDEFVRFARHFYELGKQSKEPVSEDLEEAAEEYSRGLDYYHYTGDDPAIAFIAGAEWQKEEMLKDAVEADGEVNKLANRVWVTPTDDKKFHQEVYDHFVAGQKVKIVIIPIKED